MAKIDKIKKIGCMFLATSMAVVFCACGKKGTDNKSGESTDNTVSNNVNSKAAAAYHVPDAIKNRGELNVGVPTDGIYTFSKDKDGKKSGCAVHFAEEIAKSIGENININYIEKTSRELLDSVSNGEVDFAISNYFDNRSVLSNNFTVSNSWWPVSAPTFNIYAKNGQESNYNDAESLEGKKLAISKTSYMSDYISNVVPGAELVECDNTEACIEAVINGTADVVVSDDAEWNNVGDGNDNPDISKCPVTIPEHPEDIGAFIPVMKNNTELVNVINSKIDELKESNTILTWMLETENSVTDEDLDSEDLKSEE